MGRELRAREESCDIVQSIAREVLQNADRFQHGGELRLAHRPGGGAVATLTLPEPGP